MYEFIKCSKCFSSFWEARDFKKYKFLHIKILQGIIKPFFGVGEKSPMITLGYFEQEAINNYKGTILLVCHEADFYQAVASRVINLEELLYN